MTNATPTPERARDFSRPAALVAELHALDRGRLAELRRQVGSGEGAHWLTGLLYRSGYGERGSRAARLVAGLFALKPASRDDGEAPSADTLAARAGAADSLATQLARVHLEQNRQVQKKATARSSTEQRFLALLDADRDGLEHHLRQAVQLVQARDMQPDWTHLLADVTYWGDAVRRRWADDFYRYVYRDLREAEGTDPGSDSGTDTPTDPS